jgi:E3 ubiquitin-protein ligase MARCH6
MGHYIIYGFKFQEHIEKTNFEGLITTIIGYMIFALILIAFFIVMSISSFYRYFPFFVVFKLFISNHSFISTRARKIIGLCYIIIKVGLLVVIELCIFPLICGIWLDVCSLKIFNSTITERISNFQMASGTSVFIHWLIGMVYVFYFATSVYLLREVLRPGVLWFLRNLNDPDFNPIQEVFIVN